MNLIYLLALAVAGTAAAADEPVLTFDTAIARALERAPQMEVQRAALESAEALQVSAGRLPDPAMIVGVDNLPLNGPDAFSTTSDSMTMTKVGLMQSFPSGRQREGERERASAEVSLAHAELVATRAEVARQTAVAWFQLASATETRRRLEGLEDDLRLGADAARAALRAGRGSATDALGAQAAVAALKGRLLQLRGDEKRAEAELGRWIGAEAIATPGPSPSLNELPGNVETLRESAQLHALIAPLDARIAVAAADLDLARATRRPGWGVEFTYGKRGPGYSDMGQLQFTLDLPLFAKNRQSPMITARGAELRKARAERDTQIAMRRAELQQMVISWQQLGEQLQFLDDEQLALARERSRAALGGFRAGSLDARAVVDAFNSETDLLLSRAALTLDRAMAWSYLRYAQAGTGDNRGTP